MTEVVSPELAGESRESGQMLRAGRSRQAIALFVVATVLVLAADQVIKFWSFATVAGQPVQLDGVNSHHSVIPPHDAVDVLPGVLTLKLTLNTGAVFGLGKGGRWIFIAVSLLATGIILRIFWRSSAKARSMHLALALILAGALGNLYDRMMYAAVRDMFWMLPNVDLPFGLNWPSGETRIWPWIFNLADVALMVGVGMIIVLTWLHEPPPRNAESTQD